MEVQSPIEKHLVPLDLPKLAEILIKHFDLHAGRFEVAIGFRVGVGPVPGPDGINPAPGAFMGVENVHLQVVPAEFNGPNVVDAAQVNPLKKRAAKAAA